MPAPQPTTWWSIARHTRDDVAPDTPLVIGTRLVRRGDDGALLAEGVLRLDARTGRDLTGLRAAASLAAEWFEEGVPPFAFPARAASVEEEGPDAVLLRLVHGVPDHYTVQDAFGAMFETERAMVHALGLSPALLSRPPWT